MFQRQDQHKKKRLNVGWRKPKGLQNKQRLEKKGYTKKVKTGYMKTSAEVVLVSSLEELKELKPCTIQIAKISKKNKVELVKEAQKKGFTFQNFNAEKFLKSVEAKQKEKEKQKETKKDKKVQTQTKQKETKQDQKETQQDPDKKKEAEKKEAEKVLTKSDKK